MNNFTVDEEILLVKSLNEHIDYLNKGIREYAKDKDIQPWDAKKWAGQDYQTIKQLRALINKIGY